MLIQLPAQPNEWGYEIVHFEIGNKPASILISTALISDDKITVVAGKDRRDLEEQLYEEKDAGKLPISAFDIGIATNVIVAVVLKHFEGWRLISHSVFIEKKEDITVSFIFEK